MWIVISAMITPNTTISFRVKGSPCFAVFTNFNVLFLKFLFDCLFNNNTFQMIFFADSPIRVKNEMQYFS
jgi:hypothetical protein